MRRSISPVWLIILLALPTLAWGGTLRETRDIPRPLLDGYAGNCHIAMEGAPLLGAPGEPALPRLPLRLLLPEGERPVSIQVIPGPAEVLASDCSPRPLRAAVRRGASPEEIPAAFRGEVYDSRGLWPPALWENPQVHGYRGHSILTLSLCPLRWNPATGQLLWYQRLEVLVETAPAERERALSPRRSDESTLVRLSGMVDNPLAVRAIPPETPRDNPLDRGCRYLIISGENFVDELDPFLSFLSSRGIAAKVIDAKWICERFDGRDDAEKIRNYIIEAATLWPLDYLLLVGDAREDGGIPHRGLYCRAYSTTDYGIPSDLYYAGLDGNWNDDGDGRWGEPGEEDFYPEFAVGRVCASDEQDVADFIAKQVAYQGRPVSAESDRALMVGELLFSNPLTWGGDFMDEIRYGSDAHGLVTAGFPADMSVLTLYERDFEWEPITLEQIISHGANIVNHLGHAYHNQVLKLRNQDLSDLTNDGDNHCLSFLYTQGCYAGSFDDKASYGGYQGDCFVELCVTEPTGFVAAVANSRYGWGDSGDTAGPSQFYDREFFDAVFGEGLGSIGHALDDSRCDLAWMCADNGAMRWCHYELNLFGDPSLRLWTGVPRALQVQHKDFVNPGSTEIRVNLNDPSLPESGALAVMRDMEGQYYEVLGAEGPDILQFTPHCVAGQSYQLYVWAEGREPYRALIHVGDPDEAWEEIAENWALEPVTPAGTLPFGLLPNAPNPFNPSTRIFFQLDEAARVDLRVYDMKGRFVRELAGGMRLPAGRHQLGWDGRDERGRLQSSGVYLLRLVEEGGRQSSRKIILAQ